MATCAVAALQRACSASPLQRCSLLDLEKENGHEGFRKSSKASDFGAAIYIKRAAKLSCLKERGALRTRRRPALGLVSNQNAPDTKETGTPSSNTDLPDQVKPALLSQESCHKLSTEATPETPGLQKMPDHDRLPGRVPACPPALPKRVSVSPQGLQRLQPQASSGANLHGVANSRPFVKVRARRILNLQADGNTAQQGPRSASLGRQNRCAKSADDIQLSRARMQRVAHSAVTRSAEWPVMSCIRKRTEEATGYEAPRKSFKKAAENQSWQAATVCLANRVAKLSVADTKDCMTSGQVTVAGK